MGIIANAIRRSYGKDTGTEDNKQTQDLDSSEEIKVDAEVEKLKARVKELETKAAEAISEAEAGKKEIEELVSHKTPVIMTKVKFFDSSNVSMLECKVNEFLETLDSSRIKDISFNSHYSKYDKYAAMVVYETIE